LASYSFNLYLSFFILYQQAQKKPPTVSAAKALHPTMGGYG
jgi:hypothetical protein